MWFSSVSLSHLIADKYWTTTYLWKQEFIPT